MEKNFETIEYGEWYETVDGLGRAKEDIDRDLVLICGRVYDKRGISRIYGHKVIRKINPPVIEPMPAPKKKVTVTAYCWVSEMGNILHHKKIDEFTGYATWKRFPAGDITGEVEE